MASIEAAECKLKDHSFSDRFFEKNVNFYVLSLKDSFLLWIGHSTPKMSNLAVSVQTKFDVTPTGSILMGDSMDSTSCGLAKRLAKKTNKQIFVSCNLATSDSQLLPLVEKRIFEEMKTFPEKF